MQGSYLGTTDDTSSEHVRVVLPVVVDMHRVGTLCSWVVDMFDIDFDIVDALRVARVESFGYIGDMYDTDDPRWTPADDAVVSDAVDIVHRLFDRGQQ